MGSIDRGGQVKGPVKGQVKNRRWETLVQQARTDSDAGLCSQGLAVIWHLTDATTAFGAAMAGSVGAAGRGYAVICKSVQWPASRPLVVKSGDG